MEYIDARIPVQGPLVQVTVPRGGAKETFEVGRDDFADWVKGDQGQKVKPVGPWIDLLASHFIATRAMSNGDVQLVVVSPEKVRTFPVGLSGTPMSSYDPITCITPPLVWFLNYRKSRLVDSRLLVSQDRVLRSLRDGVRLQIWPFGHGQTPNGTICWGETAWNSLPLSDPMAVENVFFNGGINEHVCFANLGTDKRGLRLTSLKAWAAANQAKGDAEKVKEPKKLPVVWDPATGHCHILDLKRVVGNLGMEDFPEEEEDGEEGEEEEDAEAPVARRV